MQFGLVQLTPNLHGIVRAFDTDTAGLEKLEFFQQMTCTVYMDNPGLHNWGKICSFLFPFVLSLQRRGLDDPYHTTHQLCHQGCRILLYSYSCVHQDTFLLARQDHLVRRQGLDVQMDNPVCHTQQQIYTKALALEV
jgi:hypothetical protein